MRSISTRGDLQPVQEAAAKHGVTIVLGINELDSQFSGTTLFNTVVVIGPDGSAPQSPSQADADQSRSAWSGAWAMPRACGSSTRRPAVSAR